jgi:hypothetical protein
MAQPRSNLKGGVITLQNFLKGFPPLGAVYTAANSNLLPDPENFSGDTIGINPYRFPNTISPSPQRIASTNESIIANTPRHLVVRNSATGEAYMIDDGATDGDPKIYQITSTSFNVLTNAGAFPHVITGANRAYDIAIITLNTASTPTDYLIYTWDDNASSSPVRKIGLWDFSSAFTAANAADDGWATLGTGTDQKPSFLPIAQGDDGNYYVGAGNALYKISHAQPASSAFNTTPAIKIHRDYVITTVRPFKSFLMIGAVQKQVLANDVYNGKNAVFIWDYISGNFANIIYSDDNYLGSLFVKDAILYAWMGKRDNYSKLKEFTGQSFFTCCEFKGSPPAHNNPDIYKGMLAWVANGTAYTYGAPNERLPKALNCIDGNVGGFIRSLWNGTNYEYHKASLNRFERAFGSGNDTGTASLGFIKLPRESNVTKIRFYFFPLKTGAYAVMKYDKNRAGSPAAFLENSGVVSFSQDGGITEKTFSQTIDSVDELEILVDYPNGSSNFCLSVTRMEIFYEYDPTNI